MKLHSRRVRKITIIWALRRINSPILSRKSQILTLKLRGNFYTRFECVFVFPTRFECVFRMLKEAVEFFNSENELLSPVGNNRKMFSTRFECGWTSSPLVSSVVSARSPGESPIRSPGQRRKQDNSGPTIVHHLPHSFGV